MAREVAENLNDDIKDEVQAKPPATKGETPVASNVEDDKEASHPEKAADVTNSSGQNDIPSPKENVTKGCLIHHCFSVDKFHQSLYFS